MMEFNNICSLVEKRQLAQCDDRHAAMIGDEFRCEIARRLPYRLTEKQLDFNDHNKIFSACWLSEDLVVAGTKCCKLLVVDTLSSKLVEIPCLGESPRRPAVRLQQSRQCGIRSVASCPNKQFLATCGANPNHLAIYRLPDFQPFALGMVHSDWIFDLNWISDNLLVSASRDSSMALWLIENDSHHEDTELLAENPPNIEPICQFSNIDPFFSAIQSTRAPSGAKVRSLAFDKFNCALGSLQCSLTNASLHLWDALTFQQITKIPMSYTAESVCLEVDTDLNTQLYVVGSRSHVTFIDARVPHWPAGFLKSPDDECGVRSLKFNQDVLSFGTGAGNLFFYDLRAGALLSSQSSREQPFKLQTSPGYVRQDANYHEIITGTTPRPPNALYSHCYSPMRTKLFVAGGPLSLGLHGNYASVWY